VMRAVMSALPTTLLLTIVANASAHDVKYATDVGERRSISLSDGTRVELNTNSVISEHFDDSARVVLQFEGDALFDVVGKDSRPFEVRVGELQIHSAGAKFSVLRRAKEIVVTVVEGEATVSRQQGNERVVEHRQPERIEASHEALVHTEGEGMSMERRHFDARTLRRRLAWTQGKLWFEGEPLSEVLAEINRYNRNKLVLCPQWASTLPIGGIFQPTDIPSLLLALDQLGIHDVTRQRDGDDGDCPGSASTSPDFNGGAAVQAGVSHSTRRHDLKIIHR
jgi:transmembrane sensor